MLAKLLVIIKTKREVSLFTVVAMLGLISFFINRPAKSEVPKAAPMESFDTYIPDGFSLVPIEVSNYETLDSLLGSFGVVDLFTTPLNPQEKAQRIAYRVKIMRAPRNPSHFAVLIPFDQVKAILKHAGPFMVSVQNPKTRGTGFEKEPVKRRSRIVYNTGE